VRDESLEVEQNKENLGAYNNRYQDHSEYLMVSTVKDNRGGDAIDRTDTLNLTPGNMRDAHVAQSLDPSFSHDLKLILQGSHGKSRINCLESLNCVDLNASQSEADRKHSVILRKLEQKEELLRQKQSELESVKEVRFF
jgi:hypothetical protein